jgi:hypothetical protein
MLRSILVLQKLFCSKLQERRTADWDQRTTSMEEHDILWQAEMAGAIDFPHE